MCDDFFMEITYTIYNSTKQLPDSWDCLAINNIFLSKNYFKILEKSAPTNMICNYIGFFQANELIGIALTQLLDANKLDSFGDRDKCIKTAVRNFFFKKFSSRVLFVGNNLLTGQNAFYFAATVNKNQALNSLKKAADALENAFEKKGLKIHLTSYKDFTKDEVENFNTPDFKKYYQFSVQPNMIFNVAQNWKTEQDYIDALLKKYRDQYKRARKKADSIVKQKMNVQEIKNHEKTIYDLYFHVAKNAPFNTFYLAENHFSVFKEILQDDFLFYGYFIDNQLIGFNTLIKNGKTLDTYFLGYDDTIQKDTMLYLNMLYDMNAYAINNNFENIVFGRTALEIKSSIGAKPTTMFGLIKHSNPFLNHYMNKIFTYLEPAMIWNERNPFK